MGLYLKSAVVQDFIWAKCGTFKSKDCKALGDYNTSATATKVMHTNCELFRVATQRCHKTWQPRMP